MNLSHLFLCAWVVVAYSTIPVLSRNDLNEGYYWRGFTGDIPDDAFSASGKPGKNVYIAQTTHIPTSISHSPDYEEYYDYSDYYDYPDIKPMPRDGYNPRGSKLPNVDNHYDDSIIVTGQIREEQKEMEYEWGNRKQVAQDDVQILCTHNPENFEWLETNTTEIIHLEDRHLVSGGVEKNYAVYIGRITLDDLVVVGKVLHTNRPGMNGFYGIVKDSFVHYDSLFDVLAYNPPK